MFGRVEIARRNDEAVIKAAMAAWDDENYDKYGRIVKANSDLAARIWERLKNKLKRQWALAGIR